MRVILYDPTTNEWLPPLKDYNIEPYNKDSFLVRKKGEEGVNVVDLTDYNGGGSCTCSDFAFRKDPDNQGAKQKSQTCKHIRMLKFILNKIK